MTLVGLFMFRPEEVASQAENSSERNSSLGASIRAKERRASPALLCTRRVVGRPDTAAQHFELYPILEFLSV